MKILSYNIHHCTQEKIDKVLSMGADIMVLPECACQEQVTIPAEYEMEWTGVYENKGLGVIWRKEHEVVMAPWYNEQHKYMLPFIVDRRFVLIAAWPTKVEGGLQSYPQILLECLKEYQQYISQYPTLICGDYNCYIGQGDARKSTGTFEDCISLLQECGLYDLYHERTGESFGKESKATYYHLYKENMPFFLDYAFTNMKPFAYEIGKWDRDMSDHCPQMIVL